MKLCPAATIVALLLVAGCSHAPQPVTHGADASRTASAAGSKRAPATPAAPAAPAPPPPPPPHNSEAEPKAAPAASAAAGGAPATPVSTPASLAAPAVSAPLASPAVPAPLAAPAAVTAPPAAPAAPGAPAPPAPPETTAAQKPAASRDPSLIVVDQADYDPNSQLTLAQAAKAERERKAEAVPPRIVINNKTLHRYAKGGQLTVAEPKKKKNATAAAPPTVAAPTPATGASAAAAAAAKWAAAGTPTAATTAAPLAPLGTPERDERYWRGRALDIRERWRRAADRIKVLEQDVSEWRRRFYAQDDPWVRDGQIKPAWDRALEELRTSRAAVEAAKKELADFQEEGRIAGALPGWLREGIDLEPKEEPPVDPTQAIETPIYKEPGPPR
jgi:hypothetical protein